MEFLHPTRGIVRTSRVRDVHQVESPGAAQELSRFESPDSIEHLPPLSNHVFHSLIAFEANPFQNFVVRREVELERDSPRRGVGPVLRGSALDFSSGPALARVARLVQVTRGRLVNIVSSIRTDIA